MKANALSLTAFTVMAIGFGATGAASAQSVEIEDAVARVVVIPENRSDIGVEILPGRASIPALQVRRRGHDIEINGQLSNRSGRRSRNAQITNCVGGNTVASQPGEGARVEVRGLGVVALDDAPLVVLRTPRDVDVKAGEGVFGSVGPGSRSLQLQTAGCGLWTVGNVEDKAEIAVAGSGGVRMGNSRTLGISLGGSGNVRARETSDLRIAIGGSGSVRLARLNGPARIQIGGSGDVEIQGGRASSLNASVAGSGDVRFDGVADRVTASIAGSGDVYVRRATGQVSRSVVGSGKVRIGD